LIPRLFRYVSSLVGMRFKTGAEGPPAGRSVVVEIAVAQEGEIVAGDVQRIVVPEIDLHFITSRKVAGVVPWAARNQR